MIFLQQKRKDIYIYIKIKTKENSEGDRILKKGGHANEIFTSTRVTSLMNVRR